LRNQFVGTEATRVHRHEEFGLSNLTTFSVIKRIEIVYQAGFVRWGGENLNLYAQSDAFFTAMA
jgi:hypothetical protein